ncbi:hypothetical protein KIH74_12100 [Kineosporia sp. J2-2]|uniref:Integral membrane protein n=1 Tax=Kineosporia corallincola TaxID=2835133 RepID=A0ABS5TF00_9ACTN|nr:hypothetical protein [Kineosporia corallincola]MBT0769670.1 hypothetical protein [Kineosporia corallincola]
METIVVGYLAAFAAGRVNDLADRIGAGATDAVDRSLAHLYDNLVHRAPALRWLREGHPESVTEAERQVRGALRDHELRALARMVVEDVERRGGAGLLPQSVYAVQSFGHGLAVGGTLHDQEPAWLGALRGCRGPLRVAIGLGLLLTVGGLLGFVANLALGMSGRLTGGDPGAGFAISFGCAFFGILVANVAVIVQMAKH